MYDELVSNVEYIVVEHDDMAFWHGSVAIFCSMSLRVTEHALL